MSSPEHVLRCRGWLEEQLEGLGGLRNAQSRDPSFKAWRQNSLTVLQRIWPDQPDRAERFRRITFSPPSSSSDSRQQREWYSRGCQEATTYLRALLEEVDTVGVPAAREQDSSGSSSDAPNAEDDFPVLDLPAAGAAPRGAGRSSDPKDEIELDASGARRPGADRAAEPARDVNAPAPPSLKVDVTAQSPSGSFAAPTLRAPLEPPKSPPPVAIPPVAAPPSPPEPSPDVQEAPRPRAPVRAPEAKSPPVRRMVRGPKSRKPAPRGRLKDMLGLQGLDQPKPAREKASAPETRSAGAAKSPQPSSGVPGSKVTIGPSRRTAPARIEPDLNDEPVLPIASVPAPESAPEPVPVPAPPVPVPVPIAQAPTPPPSPEPVVPAEAEPEEMEIDPETFARATEDFLKNSPVLGLQGRPVQRASDATSFVEPDAVAVATLAVDLTRLGVPEEARSPMREHLMVLARQLEAGKPSWSAMQAAISNAMQHPALARRLVPVLLPWLERAA
jgi:hypothetical protein